MECTDCQPAKRVITSHLPRLHRLALPTPWSVGDVNVYLLEPGRPGESLTLLDTGPNWEATDSALWHKLAHLGHSIRDIDRILISHPHPDHYGLAAKLVTESGAAVCAHPYSQATLATGNSNHQHTLSFYHNWLNTCGVPAAVQNHIGQARQDTHDYAQPVIINQFLKDGDILRMGGCDWQVLFTPGHSGGMLCFFQPETRALLASDHLIGEISSNPIVEPPSAGQSERPKRLLQYIQQLERVANLQATIAYPGHGRPIKNVANLVHQRKVFHQTRAEEIWLELSKRPMTIYQLSIQHFGDNLPALHAFLALSEVQGHIDLLQANDRVTCLVSNGIHHWTAAG